MSYNIAIIIPYFGEKPPWYDYFAKSCQYNPQVNWLIFTDCLGSQIDAPNIKYYSMSLAEFNKLASVKLQAKINIRNPYKICDFKPTYAKIFEDYIQDFLFWGYGDIDLIYGNILKLLPENFKEYDIISMHHSFVPGHFCILKNTVDIVHLFQQSPHWKNIMISKSYRGFDENLLTFGISTNLIWHKSFKQAKVKVHILKSKVLKYLGRVQKERKKTENQGKESLKDFNDVIMYFTDAGRIKTYFGLNYACDVMYSKQNLKKWELVWNKGILKNKYQKEELAYFHFQVSKVKMKFSSSNDLSLSNKFLISKSGIKTIK